MAYSPVKLLAYGHVDGTTVANSTGRGCAVATTGAGVYTLTLPVDFQKDATERVVHVTVNDAAGAIANITAQTDQIITITTFTLPAGLAGGPVAANHNFDYTVWGADFA